MASTVPWLELGGQAAPLPCLSLCSGEGLRPCEELGGPGGACRWWRECKVPCLALSPAPPQISSKRSSSFKRAITNGQRALPQDGLLDEPGLGVYKRFVRYVAYEILPREVDRHWYFYRHRSCPPPVFMASVTLAQVSLPIHSLHPRPGPAWL